MDYIVLRDELLADPLGRGYSGMTDEAAATDLNTAYRERDILALSASQILNVTDLAEYNALSDSAKDAFWRVLHMGSKLNPWGMEASIMTTIFGAGSDTIANLQTLRRESITRGVELALGHIRVGHVIHARTL